MALEATLIMMDNSSYALNGDYLPTRWESQVDAASLLIQAKLESNIQSSVGLGLMGGRQVQILCTMTNDSTKINSYLFGVKVHGELHFTKALQIGALALKHRLNETQKQRIICFIGSKIVEDADTLKIFGKKLKKNGVAVDLICFGDCSQEQRNKIQVFMNAIQMEENSHSMFIEPGEVYLSQKLLSSAFFNQAPMMGQGGGIQQDDPQLAQAIRLSLQDNQPQQPNPAPSTNQQQTGQARQQVRQPTQEQLEQLAIRLSLAQAGENKMEEQNNDKKQEKDPDEKKQQ